MACTFSSYNLLKKHSTISVPQKKKKNERQKKKKVSQSQEKIISEYERENVFGKWSRWSGIRTSIYISREA